MSRLKLREVNVLSEVTQQFGRGAELECSLAPIAMSSPAPLAVRNMEVFVGQESPFISKSSQQGIMYPFPQPPKQAKKTKGLAGGGAG